MLRTVGSMLDSDERLSPMNRFSPKSGHLRHLAAALRSEARMIEHQNRSLGHLESEMGVFFPVEKSTNMKRVKNLNDAADVLDALADHRVR
jgi:hypothetical protein